MVKLGKGRFNFSFEKLKSKTKKSNGSIKAKLTAAFLVVTLLITTLSIITYVFYRGAIKDYDHIMENLIIANEVPEKAEQLYKDTREYILQPSEEGRNNVEKGIDQLIPIAEKVRDNTLVQNKESKTMARGIVNLMKRFKDGTIKAMDFRDDDNFSGAVENLDQVKKVSGFIDDNIRNYIASELDYGIEIRQNINKKSNLLGICIVILIPVFAIASILFGIRYSKSITDALTKIANSSEMIADGDLTTEDIQVKTGDELSVLAQSFNKMADNLRDLINSIRDSSSQVAASSQQLTASAEQGSEASEQIATTVQQMASGAVEQSEKTGNAAENISHMVKGSGQIEQRSKEITDSAGKALKAADSGDKRTKILIEQMNTIKEKIDFTAQALEELNKKSMDIGEIIYVIGNIAEQTNLLSLNASIEAARAGEHGRGFAVVAQEVRKLAEGSRQSAEKISDLVKEIQSDTKRVSSSMQEGVQEIQEGEKAAEDVAGSFKEINATFGDVDAEVKEISKEIEQMVEQLNDVDEIVSNIAVISKQFSTGSQEVSAAVEEQTAGLQEIVSSASVLSDMAAELQNIVDKFKVE
ncbi:MAG: methyl-accepting chemotaxis protein [Clostridia bacterium]|nr:methyl-accepting chemotaxis protein [Clostridia bacterium]